MEKKPFDPREHLTLISGKEYLPVAFRLVWFRELYPNGTVETEHIEITNQRAVFKARVTAIGEGGEIFGSSTGYGSETPEDFRDHIEKAETKSIGRALAALGFGTQFSPELEEGQRLADTPRTPRASQMDQRSTGGGTGFKLITEKQEGLLTRLLREKGWSQGRVKDRLDGFQVDNIQSLGSRDASTWIDELNGK